MKLQCDARVPVVFGNVEQAGLSDAVLTESAIAALGPSPLHEAGCACCVQRSPAARALAGLIHDRARGKILYFTRVFVAIAASAAVEAALESDAVASACFRADRQR